MRLPLINNYKKTYKSLNCEVESIFSRKVAFSFLSDLTFAFGVIVLFYFCVLPLLSYFFYSPVSAHLIKPFGGTSLSQNYVSDEESFSFKELSTQEPHSTVRSSSPKFFKLSIPKLKIENAFVEVDSKGLDPKEMLGHYIGTSLPGESGNSFIYGHSSLPVLYDPKNYSTIFTKLTDLINGDTLYVEINNKILTYEVSFTKELLPSEVNPYSLYLAPKNNEESSTITLMTCTPAGTTKNRYIVVAKLINY